MQVNVMNAQLVWQMGVQQLKNSYNGFYSNSAYISHYYS